MRSIKFAFVLFLASFLFLINLSFLSAASSQANHTLILLCNDGTCTEQGLFCNMTLLNEGYVSPLVDLSYTPNGCSDGISDPNYVPNGNPTCCPLGNSCQYDEARGAHFCVPINAFCSFYEDNYTIKYPESIYQTSEAACNADPLNLGTRLNQSGVDLNCGDRVGSSSDTESSRNGIYRITDCTCEWESNRCNNVYTATCDDSECEDGNTGPGSSGLTNPKCSKYYDYGECVNNQQTFSWTASAKYSNGVVIPITDNKSHPNYKILEYLNCFPGTQIRSCGEPTIELPGFSTFALIFSLTIIIFFYVLRIKKED